jgi:hypothetical protein
MKTLVGMLHGERVYDDDPALVTKQSDACYMPVYSASALLLARCCEYCGRVIRVDGDCASCGAPVGVARASA